MEKENTFKKYTFYERMKSMLHIDIRRMLTSKFFYIMAGICFVIPILILVMTTMMDGTVSVNHQTGEETIIEGFDSVWQAIATSYSASTTMSMDLTSMCNINMLYFIIAVFVCVFISEDFRSGYSKNLFTHRSNKKDYVISKLVVSFLAGAVMILVYFVGALIGGAVSSLSFDLGDVSAINVVMCMLSKIFLVGIFTSIYVLASVIAKTKSWLSMIISFGIGMLFFAMIPMISPLDSTIVNVLLTLVGSLLFSIGFGVISNKVLNKTSLV